MRTIQVEHLVKQYRQYAERQSLLGRVFSGPGGRMVRYINALDHVSFSVEAGETLGVIGRNGSGKTTLLRLLSGVTAPTSGRVRVMGQIAPLIGIGVGFNGELTGRENVFVNGRLLGVPHAELEERFDDIVAFSEIGDYIETPVKFYSSGMFLRLAFAIAIHSNPRVLFVDEILAVGDVAFQARCYEKMRAVQDAGGTVVVVTHNLTLLHRLASRTIVLRRGELVHDGLTEDALSVYHGIMQADELRRSEDDIVDPLYDKPRKVSSVRASLVDDHGQPTAQVNRDQTARILVRAEFNEEVVGPIVGFLVESPGFGTMFMCAIDPLEYQRHHGPDHPMQVEIRIPRMPLLPGTFIVRVSVRSPGPMDDRVMSGPVLFHHNSAASGAGVVEFNPTFIVDGREVPVASPSLLDLQ